MQKSQHADDRCNVCNCTRALLQDHIVFVKAAGHGTEHMWRGGAGAANGWLISRPEESGAASAQLEIRSN